MKKYDVMFLCQFFFPEYNSSATLPWDTAKYLADSRLNVGVLCGYPREYNAIGSVPLREEKNHVYIKRLKYWQLKRGRKLGRLINYFSFTFKVFLHIGELRGSKSVIVYSNPPVLPAVAVLANSLYGTKIIFVSYDVYPEVAYASKSLTPNGMIAKVMRYLNKKLFSRVSAVVALTDEMKSFLLENRETVSKEQIAVIPNWAHETNDSDVSDALAEFGFETGDFIVAYFGNMGICQDVETFLQAMDLLKDERHIKFLIAGHGSKKHYVEEKTAQIKNVRILDFLTGKVFEQATAISSCGIVSLEKGLKGMCAPSKYYSYLKAGIPVLSITEPDTYLVKEIKEKNIGEAIELGNAEALAEAIKFLYKNPDKCEEMARRARWLYEDKYEMNKSLGRYYDLIRKTVEN